MTRARAAPRAPAAAARCVAGARAEGAQSDAPRSPAYR